MYIAHKELVDSCRRILFYLNIGSLHKNSRQSVGTKAINNNRRVSLQYISQLLTNISVLFILTLYNEYTRKKLFAFDCCRSAKFNYNSLVFNFVLVNMWT